MTFPANAFLLNSLNKRRERNVLRKLSPDSGLVDFCSNDYLGFAQSDQLKNNINAEYSLLAKQTNGATGSRLLAGNTDFAEKLEMEIAAFHEAEAGLIFNSGYDANVGLFSALGRKGDTIIYDELIHASVHDGIKLSSAAAVAFKHNDLANLEDQLQGTKGGMVYVAIETVYSMDGDNAPLSEISKLCKNYNANLIVDEAHSTGVIGKQGKGMVQDLGFEKEVFARVHTFSKALGCHGAIVLGSNLLRDFLINFSRSFVFTTALPIKSLLTIQQAYLLLQNSDDAINTLNENIAWFKLNIGKNKKANLMEIASPIQGLIVQGNKEVKDLAEKVKRDGFDVRAIVSPTVPVGTERIRICIHAFNTKKEIEGLCNSIHKHMQ